MKPLAIGVIAVLLAASASADTDNSDVHTLLPGLGDQSSYEMEDFVGALYVHNHTIGRLTIFSKDALSMGPERGRKFISLVAAERSTKLSNFLHLGRNQICAESSEVLPLHQTCMTVWLTEQQPLSVEWDITNDLFPVGYFDQEELNNSLVSDCRMEGDRCYCKRNEMPTGFWCSLNLPVQMPNE